MGDSPFQTHVLCRTQVKPSHPQQDQNKRQCPEFLLYFRVISQNPWGGQASAPSSTVLSNKPQTKEGLWTRHFLRMIINFLNFLMLWVGSPPNQLLVLTCLDYQASLVLSLLVYYFNFYCMGACIPLVPLPIWYLKKVGGLLLLPAGPSSRGDSHGTPSALHLPYASPGMK